MEKDKDKEKDKSKNKDVKISQETKIPTSIEDVEGLEYITE